MIADDGAVPRSTWQRRIAWCRYLVCCAVVGVFVWAIGQFYDAKTGFTSLLSIGEGFEQRQVTALKGVSYYAYQDVLGYDGAYYVQIALYPTLDNPELLSALDNPSYRARRILLSWTAWALGLGHPVGVVQAEALVNPLCWLLLAWVLLHWFPPTSWQNIFRWSAVLFSHGMCMSVRNSLTDGLGLLLVAAAMRWLDTGRQRAGVATLALGCLAKETSILAAIGLDRFAPASWREGWRSPQWWLRATGMVVLVALPLALWMGYIRWKLGPDGHAGFNNFTLPFAGYIEKWRDAWGKASEHRSWSLDWATMGTTIALGAQCLFLLLRWRPAERWWRVGVLYALMMVFLSQPVWEGDPGAATRVLLPMALAFNVLVPHGRRWLPLLLLGNLSVGSSLYEYSPPHDFYEIKAPRALRETVTVAAGDGWHGPEMYFTQVWRWSRENSELTLTNSSTRPLHASLHTSVVSAGGPRTIRMTQDGRVLWTSEVDAKRVAMTFDVLLPPRRHRAAHGERQALRADRSRQARTRHPDVEIGDRRDPR